MVNVWSFVVGNSVDEFGELSGLVLGPLKRGEDLPKAADQRTTLTFTLDKDQHRSVELLAWALNGSDTHGPKIDMGRVVRKALKVLAQVTEIAWADEDENNETPWEDGHLINDSLRSAIGRELPEPKRRARRKV